ncbi:MAG: hypothetical protein RLN88_10935 [Ekhidna sp.]|uniref:hypothetical protein n=1 Tax=Ekhidna sp. TaxID=2608089 RepID=UPI0032EE8434
MKAVTNVTKQIIHFSFNDCLVPDHLRSGGKGFCHQMAQTFIRDSLSLNLRYKRKNFKVVFITLEEEVEIKKEDERFYADLKGKICSPKWFIEEVGSDDLIIEINFSSKAKIGKQAAYRNTNNAAIEINLKDCYSFRNEKYYSNYSDEQLEKAQLTLQKFIRNSNFNCKVLHFPSQKKKRFQESVTTRRAKEVYLNQSKNLTPLVANNRKPNEEVIIERPTFPPTQEISIEKVKEKPDSPFRAIINRLIGLIKSKV